MIRGALSNPDFVGQFSGHETFPLRHLWLRKAYDAVSESASDGKRIFTDPDAIARFGVGKNMVASIRFWALACEIICEDDGGYSTTPLGDLLFETEGCDGFMESIATTWLIHWLLAGRAENTTTWYWAFNHFNQQNVDVESLSKTISEYTAGQQKSRASLATLKRDAQCFIRSYANRSLDKKVSDDLMEPVLAELGLLRNVTSATYQFQRGPKPSLPDGVFNFALHDFWMRHAPDQATLSVEAIAFEPGSPGRVFRLDEQSLVNRLAKIDDTSGESLIWSDTAGLRNVSRRSDQLNSLDLLLKAYPDSLASQAA